MLAGRREGGLQTEVEVARLLLRLDGLFEFGLAGNLPLALAATVEFAILAGRFLPASLAIRGAGSRASVAAPAGFALDAMLALAFAADFAARSAIEMPLAFVPVRPVAGSFMAAIHRVRSACQMIALRFAARVAPEHGLPGGLFRRRIERSQTLAGRPLEASEDSSTTRIVFAFAARSLRTPAAVPRPWAIPSWRAR